MSIIEISDSTLEKDLKQKQIVYAAEGILEYWVIDLKAQQLIVFQQPSANEYQIQQTYTQGTLSPTAFDKIELSVEKLLSFK
ncbi:MAG: Uma2 family endonuclease [Microcoleaceae cyanobacterium]